MNATEFFQVHETDARFILDQLHNNDVSSYQEIAENIHEQMLQTRNPLPLEKLFELITQEWPKAHQPEAMFDYELDWSAYRIELTLHQAHEWQDWGNELDPAGGYGLSSHE